MYYTYTYSIGDTQVTPEVFVEVMLEKSAKVISTTKVCPTKVHLAMSVIRQMVLHDRDQSPTKRAKLNIFHHYYANMINEAIGREVDLRTTRRMMR